MKYPINWKDHIITDPDIVHLTPLGDDDYRVTKPGVIEQQGTPQNATNFNDMDLASIEGILMANFNTTMIRMLKDKVDGLAGELIQVTLTNSQKYPFNNSKKTVSLGTIRNTKDYTVITEFISKGGAGGVGDIIISDKMLNGFKIEYTGAAPSVTINCFVQGGI